MKRIKHATFALVITCGPKLASVAGKGFIIIRHHLETISIIHEVIRIPVEWERNQ